MRDLSHAVFLNPGGRVDMFDSHGLTTRLDGRYFLKDTGSVYRYVGLFTVKSALKERIGISSLEPEVLCKRVPYKRLVLYVPYNNNRVSL